MATHRHTFSQAGIDRARGIKKRLFVLCDGTWQDGVNKTRPLTNVATLARCLAPMDDDGCLQIVYYDGGVGNSSGTMSQLIDGATGRGISAKIRNAYSFLSHNYNFEPTHGRDFDEIVLVGFSRGAFAVQCLASFISDTGLFERQHLYYLRGLFTLWSHRKMPGGEETFGKELQHLKGSKLLHGVTVTACAVWDTVGALGGALQLPPRSLSFVGKTVPSGVRNAFHALALDEHRRNFSPVLWEALETDSRAFVSQCWFLGSHRDVGGNGDAALGALTLLWMVGKLHDQVGVKFVEREIAKHLKHKFLEWDFTVNKLRKTFKETRALSIREHSGQATLHGRHWNLLGRRTRAPYLKPTGPLQTEIHFTVRIAMAQGRNSSETLKAWSTSWGAPSSPQDVTDIMWHAPPTMPGTNEDDNADPGRSASPPSSTVMLREHPLNKNGKEYDLLSRWSKDLFHLGPTDRTEFAMEELERRVQEDGAQEALDTLANLLRDHMKFGEDRKLAADMLYQSPAGVGAVERAVSDVPIPTWIRRCILAR